MKYLTSRTKQQELDWRRNKVLELSSRGYSEREISEILKLNDTAVHRDLAYIRKQAHENIQHHIHETIPAEYQKAMNTLNQVLRMTWSIISKTEDDMKTRLQALALINDVNKYRTELVTNGVIVNDALHVVQSKMEHLNGEEKRLLRDINEEKEDVVQVGKTGESSQDEGLEGQKTYNRIF